MKLTHGGIFATLDVWRTSCNTCIASALESDLKNNVLGFLLVRYTMILKWHLRCVILLWKKIQLYIQTFRSQWENCIIQLAIMLDWECGGDHRASTPSEMILEGDVAKLVEIYILMMVTRNNLMQHKVIVLKIIAIPQPTCKETNITYHSTWKVRPLGSLCSPPPLFLEYNWTKSWWQ